MNKYLGEMDIRQDQTPYADYTEKDWALYFISKYGGIDGAHHKDWVMDQVARVLKGTPVTIKLASWEGGHIEYRVSTGEPSQAYKDWVHEICEWNEATREYTYFYEEGIAP